MDIARGNQYAIGYFFFQAEDGIRDWSVTGVQTCALPISAGGEAIALLYVDAPVPGPVIAKLNSTGLFQQIAPLSFDV